jgi:hypothetical protein
MKYQSQHDLLDPDVPSPQTDVDVDGNDDSDAPSDAYVIGEDGKSVREIDAHATRRSRGGPSRWAKSAAVASVVLFVVMTFWNLSSLLQDPPAPPKPTPFQAKQALYLGVLKIDAYRRVHGVAPDSLADAGLPEAGTYAYRRVGPTRYVLSFGGNASKLEYDSNQSKAQFFGSPTDMLTMGGSK